VGFRGEILSLDDLPLGEADQQARGNERQDGGHGQEAAS